MLSLVWDKASLTFGEMCFVNFKFVFLKREVGKTLHECGDPEFFPKEMFLVNVFRYGAVKYAKLIVGIFMCKC